jgi:hypothetical protein
MIVGDHMARAVPDKASAALFAATFAFDICRSKTGCGTYDLNHRRRHPFEQADCSAFGFRQIAPRGNRPWRGRGVQQGVEVGPSEQGGKEQNQGEDSCPEKNVGAWSHSKSASLVPASRHANRVRSEAPDRQAENPPLLKPNHGFLVFLQPPKVAPDAKAGSGRGHRGIPGDAPIHVAQRRMWL